MSEDKKLQTPEVDDSESESSSDLTQLNPDRRRFLITSVLGIGGILLGGATDANADYNPYQKKITPALEALYPTKSIPPEKLTPQEKLIMNKSMKYMWETYLNRSFWDSLTTKSAQIQGIVEQAMDSANREKLSYKEPSNGNIVIEKRNENSPNVSIKISFGRIVEVNGIKIDHKTISKPDADWKTWNGRVERISPKVSALYLLAGTAEASTMPKIRDIEWDWFFQYCFEMPHRFYRLLELKGDKYLTPQERNFKTFLGSLLQNHPKNRAEFEKDKKRLLQGTILNPSLPLPGISNRPSSPASRPSPAQSKTTQLFVWRRGKVEIVTPQGQKIVMPKTPTNMIELVMFSDKSRRAIAGISQDGFLMLWKDNKWVKVDNRPTPFSL